MELGVVQQRFREEPKGQKKGSSVMEKKLNVDR